MADHPYGAPRQTWVQNAGTNIVHLFVLGLAVLEAKPNIDSKNPDLEGVGLFESEDECRSVAAYKRGDILRRGKCCEAQKGAPHILCANI